MLNDKESSVRIFRVNVVNLFSVNKISSKDGLFISCIINIVKIPLLRSPLVLSKNGLISGMVLVLNIEHSSR